MKTYFTKLSSNLEKGILKISNSDQTEIQKCEARKLLALEHYKELQKFASDYQFKSELEEIEYFRSQKPTLVASLMYHYKTSKINKQSLLNDGKTRKKILQFELQKVEAFYSRHLDFISYYNSGQTNYDEALFLRKNMNPSSIPAYILLRDDSNNITNGDYLVTKLILNLKLHKFIQNELCKKSENQPPVENTKTPNSEIYWTAPKVSLIELVYALFSEGVINNGEIEIKKMVKEFELFFNVKLNDPYRSFSEIKQRKKTPTLFIDSLRDSLLDVIQGQGDIL
jgi:hypothetical protein